MALHETGPRRGRTLWWQRKNHPIFYPCDKLLYQIGRRIGIFSTADIRNDSYIYTKENQHRFRVPAYIVMDNGPNFGGPATLELTRRYDFELKHSSSSHATGNGQPESSNKRIIEEIKKRVFESRKKWFTDFKEILWAYRQREENQQAKPLSSWSMT